MDMKDGEVRGSQVIGASINYSPEFSATEPNLNLLRRISESGGGKLLDPSGPAVNPFLHDRKKTYQPRDLWESLLKFAILLFVVDVGVRRILIGREEWAKVGQFLRRYLLFWQGVPRTPEAEESLAALLARRDQVRSKQQTTPTLEPRADLFRPEKPVTDLETEPADAMVPAEESSRPTKPAKPPPGEAPPNTTSRLLEAKRRAQKRKG
jgi:hypothetical protein